MYNLVLASELYSPPPPSAHTHSSLTSPIYSSDPDRDPGPNTGCGHDSESNHDLVREDLLGRGRHRYFLARMHEVCMPCVDPVSVGVEGHGVG